MVFRNELCSTYSAVMSSPSGTSESSPLTRNFDRIHRDYKTKLTDTLTKSSNSQKVPCIIAHLVVLYDYSYEYKTRGLVTITKHEKLYLLEKTNESWWKVVRPPESEGPNNKIFFVPAQYVRVDKSIDEIDVHILAKSIGPKSFPSDNHDKGPKVPPKPKSENMTSIRRNDSSRGSHRIHSKTSSSSPKKASKLKLTASLEELSKQIVFPGVTSESTVDLTRSNISPNSNSSFVDYRRNYASPKAVVNNEEESNRCHFRNDTPSTNTTMDDSSSTRVKTNEDHSSSSRNTLSSFGSNCDLDLDSPNNSKRIVDKKSYQRTPSFDYQSPECSSSSHRVLRTSITLDNSEVKKINGY